MSNDSTTTALAPYDPRTDQHAFEPRNIDQALGLAKQLHSSGLMPRALAKPEAVLAAIVMGRELGFSAMQSVRMIHVIEGKPALSADAMVGLVKSRPDKCEWFVMVESTAAVATYETLRRGDPRPTKMSFSLDDAKAAQLLGKDNWRKFPAAMLRARCSSALARAVYPDVVGGMYDPEEMESTETRPMGTVTVLPAESAAPREQASGNVIDAQFRDVPAPTSQPDAKPDEEKMLLAKIEESSTLDELGYARGLLSAAKPRLAKEAVARLAAAYTKRKASLEATSAPASPAEEPPPQSEEPPPAAFDAAAEQTGAAA